MGGSAKGEERIFCQTNYFEELTNFFTELSVNIYFTGPELSKERHQQTVELNSRLKGYFYKGTTSEFLLNEYQDLLEVKEKLPQANTLLIGFNPGFGSGYDKLLESWALDLVMLINL